MEIATPVGLILGFVAICVSYIMEGGSPLVLIKNPGAIILVLGATMGVAIASNKMTDISGGIKATLAMILPGKKVDGPEAVNQLMGFADTARRDGLLALEEQVKEVQDPFMKRGLELVIDGTDSDEVADVLEADIAALKERHKVAAKFHADCGAFAPTIGIIGTVLGLVHALEDLTDPAKLGHSISAAFLATLWGVMTANCFFLPISNKMKRATAAEVAHRHMVLQGILAIQAGVSPRAVGEKLKSHLPPAQRESVGEKKAA